MIKTIINAQVVLENGIIWDGFIKISDGIIIEIGKNRYMQPDDCGQMIDAHGAYVGPGFVDIHLHGGGGFSSCFETERAAKFFLSHGETTILAGPDYNLGFDDFMRAIRSVKKTMDSGAAPNVRGMYAEGPYINPDFGAYSDINPWRGPIDFNQAKALVDEMGTYVRVWTISAERDGIVEFLEYARNVNPDVIFALGHSNATPMQIRALGRFRPKILTHAMCATGTQPVYGGTCGYGPNEYCFKEPEMYAELICDSGGIHVHPEMQQLLLHNKGITRTILITDCTGHEKSSDNFEHDDLNFDHNGDLAGSNLTMDLACRNIMSHTNVGIAQAFNMSSLNPARALGLDDEIGSVEIGKKADLVFVDDRFDVKQVMLNGCICSL